VQLVSKISNLCDPDPPTSQTDGQTDGRHAISIPRYALVHRAEKTQPLSHNRALHSIKLILSSVDIQGVSLKTAPFIFDYNSHINGPICVKFAANVR